MRHMAVVLAWSVAALAGVDRTSAAGLPDLSPTCDSTLAAASALQFLAAEDAASVPAPVRESAERHFQPGLRRGAELDYRAGTLTDGITGRSLPVWAVTPSAEKTGKGWPGFLRRFALFLREDGTAVSAVACWTNPARAIPASPEELGAWLATTTPTVVQVQEPAGEPALALWQVSAALDTTVAPAPGRYGAGGLLVARIHACVGPEPTPSWVVHSIDPEKQRAGMVTVRGLEGVPVVTWAELDPARGGAQGAGAPGPCSRGPFPLRRQAPEYPAEALSRRIQGRVVTRVTITDQGTVSDVQILRSDDAVFDEAARKAISSWVFRPALDDGVPVQAVVTIPLDFDLRYSD